MNQAERKIAILVGASVAAAAAGIAIAALLFKCRNNNCSEDEQKAENDHRHLQQVLSDCYNKIHEIEARLPAVEAPRVAARAANAARVQNGKLTAG